MEQRREIKNQGEGAPLCKDEKIDKGDHIQVERLKTKLVNWWQCMMFYSDIILVLI